MTNYREILRLNSLGILKQNIAKACGCSRNTVTSVIKKAEEKGIGWKENVKLENSELALQLFPGVHAKPVYKIPDWTLVHKEMAKSGVTLSLVWEEYCEQCWQNKDIPYKRSQFYKYYSDFVQKTKATMRIAH